MIRSRTRPGTSTPPRPSSCRRAWRRSRRCCASPTSTGCRCWTHSQGRNNGYGGPAPRVRGSVIVSLRNINRVLEIDERCAYAVVEPGVRWFDLYDAIRAGGHKLWLSIADLGWGSVIGNTLDHGVTYLPYGPGHGRAVRHGGRARQRRRAGRAWARCRTTSRGTSTSAASGRRPISCSCSRTTGSSRRWACG